MPVRQAVLEIKGPDRRIEELHSATGQPIYAGPNRWADDSGILIYYIAITIFREDLEESEALDRICDWLDVHSARISQLLATKTTVEIQSAILPGDGSRALTLSKQVLRRLISLDCELRHQYSRSLSSIELAARNKGGSDKGESHQV